MDELGFLARPGAGPDVCAPRLIVGERARARDLEPLPHPGCPGFQVVGLGGRETEIVGRQHGDPVREPQPLQHRLRVSGQLLVLGGRIGGAGKTDQLDFVELMHAQQPARVLASRAGFPPETGCVGDIAFG